MSEESVVGSVTSQAAVLIDFEDLVAGAGEALPGAVDPVPFGAVELLCRSYGNATVRRAYADWSQHRFNRYQEGLMLNGIDLTHVAKINVQRTGGADLLLAIDAMDLVFTRPDIGVFVLAAGRGDYTTVVQRLRQLGRRVVGVGTEAAAGRHLVAACSEYRYWPTLVAQVDPRAAVAVAAEFDLVDAERLLVDAVRQSNQPVLAVVLRSRMLALDPSFDERNYGCGSFSDFLGRLSHLVRTERQAYDLVVSLPSGNGTGGVRAGVHPTGAEDRPEPPAAALLAELRALGVDVPLGLEDRNVLLSSVHEAWRTGRLERVCDIGDALLDPEARYLPNKRTRLKLESALVTGNTAVIPLAERPMAGALPLRLCPVGHYDGSPRAQWMSRAHIAWLVSIMVMLAHRRDLDRELVTTFFSDATETGSALVALARQVSTGPMLPGYRHCQPNP